jgi:hypothetical protein
VKVRELTVCPHPKLPAVALADVPEGCLQFRVADGATMLSRVDAN